jgi:hypothetical protein
MKISSKLELTCKLLWREACKKIEKGTIQRYIGTEGYLALIADKITRYFELNHKKTPYHAMSMEELLNLNIDCLVALTEAINYDEIEKMDKENANVDIDAEHEQFLDEQNRRDETPEDIQDLEDEKKLIEEKTKQ